MFDCDLPSLPPIYASAVLFCQDGLSESGRGRCLMPMVSSWRSAFTAAACAIALSPSSCLQNKSLQMGMDEGRAFLHHKHHQRTATHGHTQTVMETFQKCCPSPALRLCPFVRAGLGLL